MAIRTGYTSAGGGGGVGTLQAVTTLGNTTNRAMYGTGLGLAITPVTVAVYNVANTEFNLQCDLSGIVGNMRIILPSAAPAIPGQLYCVKIEPPLPVGTKVNITVDGAGTIDGQSIYALIQDNQSVFLQWIRTKSYKIIATYNRNVFTKAYLVAPTGLPTAAVNIPHGLTAGAPLYADISLATPAIVAQIGPYALTWDATNIIITPVVPFVFAVAISGTWVAVGL